MTTDTQQLTKEFSEIRISSLIEALTAQRNNAQNEVVNLAAENAVLKAALQKQALKLTTLEAKNPSSGSFSSEP